MVLAPLAVFTPLIEAGTVVAFQEITAPGVVEEIFTKVELVPEQMVWLGTSKLTCGAGFTVIVKDCTDPGQLTLLLPNTGVILMVAVIGFAVLFTATNEGILPDPEAANPIPGVEFVQLYPVPVPTSGMALLVAPLHTVTFAGAVTVGVGLTVIEKAVVAPLQEIPPPVNTEVTVIFPVMGFTPPLVTTNGAMVPVPLEFNPIAEFELAQV